MRLPYTHAKFIELVSNFDPVKNEINPEKVIESHKAFFEFMENLPGTISFIFDFSNFKYLLVSKSIRNIMGISEKVILDGDFGVVLEYFHPDDKENIFHIHKEMFGFIHNQPSSELKKFRFDFNFRMRDARNVYLQFLQQTIITTLSDDGKPLYDFSTCTDIGNQKNNNRMELTIYRLSDDNYFEEVYYYVVPATIGFGLSITEFTILKYTSEGMTSKQIAEKCFRSLHTINNHRRNILFKTGANSVAEAILKVDL